MHYLIYSSRKTSLCNAEEVNSILASSEKFNPGHDITGILLSSHEFFLQYLEGDMDSIFELYLKIKEDKRHSEVLLLSVGIIQERLFPTWNMGYKDIDSNELHLLVKDKQKSLDSFQSIFSEANDSSLDTVKLIREFYFLT